MHIVHLSLLSHEFFVRPDKVFEPFCKVKDNLAISNKACVKR